MTQRNLDERTVNGFGDEWSRFDQSALTTDQLKYSRCYFHIFPWDQLPPGATGPDLGCGSGRWARLIAPRVGTLHCIDPSEAALQIARRNLEECSNCEFHLTGVDKIPLPDDSMDFGYAIDVLHHVPDTEAALQAYVRKLKPGAPFLVYLYYASDNRPRWFRSIWRLTDPLQHLICRLRFPLRYAISQILAAFCYPLARLSGILERFGWNVDHVPLSDYRDKTFYTMRTNALDRYGMHIEQRFTAEQIEQMKGATLQDIQFSQIVPYWTAVDRRSARSNGQPSAG